jgi:hypothetical protein
VRLVSHIIVSCVLLAAAPQGLYASGHGPVFAGATPTLGKGGWQLDQVWMGRLSGGQSDDEQMLRTMISVGLTEDIQLSGSLPIPLQTPIYMPRGRPMALMSSNQDLEGILAWRFHRKPVGNNGRIESTVFGGLAIPLEEFRNDGMRATPSMHVAAATGYASRSHYFWLGGGYQRSAEMSGDRVGDTTFVSAVYGFRPPALQFDYPKPDLRFFVEAVAENTSRGLHHGLEMQFSGGSAVLVGPTALLLYKAYGIEGGMLFPVYQQTNGLPEERFRFAINFSYFFWIR